MSLRCLTTFFEFLAAAARARIIAPDFGFSAANGFLRLVMMMPLTFFVSVGVAAHKIPSMGFYIPNMTCVVLLSCRLL